MIEKDKQMLLRMCDMIWKIGKRNLDHSDYANLVLEQVEFMLQVAYNNGLKKGRNEA